MRSLTSQQFCMTPNQHVTSFTAVIWAVMQWFSPLSWEETCMMTQVTAGKETRQHVLCLMCVWCFRKAVMWCTSPSEEKCLTLVLTGEEIALSRKLCFAFVSSPGEVHRHVFGSFVISHYCLVVDCEKPLFSLIWRGGGGDLGAGNLEKRGGNSGEKLRWEGTGRKHFWDCG